jgi:hypothetical protein
VVTAVSYLFPLAELQAASDIMAAFSVPAVLENQARHLLFVTFHIQVGIRYLGIGFLRPGPAAGLPATGSVVCQLVYVTNV